MEISSTSWPAGPKSLSRGDSGITLAPLHKSDPSRRPLVLLTSRPEIPPNECHSRMAGRMVAGASSWVRRAGPGSTKAGMGVRFWCRGANGNAGVASTGSDLAAWPAGRTDSMADFNLVLRSRSGNGSSLDLGGFQLAGSSSFRLFQPLFVQRVARGCGETGVPNGLLAPYSRPTRPSRATAGNRNYNPTYFAQEIRSFTFSFPPVGASAGLRPSLSPRRQLKSATAPPLAKLRTRPLRPRSRHRAFRGHIVTDRRRKSR